MLKPLAVAVTALALGGCASVFTGGAENLTIRSMPEQAAISVIDRHGESVHSGATPATVTLSRGNSYLNRQTYEVTITKPGFSPKTFQLTWSGGWNLGPLVIGKNFGMVLVDPASGAMWKVDTESISASLEFAPFDVASNVPRFFILTPDQAPLSVWKYAERIE